MQNNDCRVESVERPRSLAPGAPGERVIDRTAGARGAVVPACTNALIATCIRSNCARLPNAALAQRSRGPAIMTRLALRLVGKIFIFQLNTFHVINIYPFCLQFATGKYVNGNTPSYLNFYFIHTQNYLF